MAPTSKLRISRVDANAIRRGSTSEGGPLPSPKPVEVSLARVDSELESRPPPPEDRPTSGADSLSGDGPVIGDGPGDQGTSSAGQSSNAG